MDNNKFQFVDDEIIGEPVKEEVKEVSKEVEINPIPVSKKLYFGFETRIVASILVILVLFVGACFLGLKVMNHTGIQKVNYIETGDFAYQICLKNDTCLPEDSIYTAKDIDKLKVLFKYNAKYEDKIKNTNKYRVATIVSSYDKENGKLVNQKEIEETIAQNLNNIGNSSSAKREISINYEGYRGYFEEYKDLYNQIEVVLYIEENKEVRKVAGLVVPFSKENFELDKYTTNTARKVEIKVNVWDTYTIIYTIAASILTIASLVLIYKTTRLVLRVTNTKSEYEDAVDSLLKDNASIITIAGEGFESIVPEEKEVVKLDSFEELAKVREEVDKPIIYNKINNIKCEFTLEDDNKLYKYVMKEVDFTEEDKNKLENK